MEGFYINIPIGVVGLVLFFCAWPKDPAHIHNPRPSRRKLWRIEWRGFVLLATGSVVTSYPFQQAAVTGWNEHFWVPFLSGVPILVGAVYVYPRWLLRNPLERPVNSAVPGSMLL